MAQSSTSMRWLALLLLGATTAFAFTAMNDSPPAPLAVAGDQASNPAELGLVHWLRDYDTAIEQSKKLNKPVFILFQEVPGCHNCTRFGKMVMSNPLIVDAIENEFVPLCIYNNEKGADAEVLKRFNEPTWNNPVARIIDANGKDLTPRMARFEPREIVTGMADVLNQRGNVPAYFELLAQQQLPRTTEQVTFSMYCFWSGELTLGAAEGVTATTPGFMGGEEVVTVAYDPQRTTLETLVALADKQAGIDNVYCTSAEQQSTASGVVGKSRVREASSFRVDKEPKYYLDKTNFRFVPMLPLQRIRVNHAVASKMDPLVFLSPGQVRVFKYLEGNKGSLPDVTLSEELVNDWVTVLEKVPSNG